MNIIELSEHIKDFDMKANRILAMKGNIYTDTEDRLSNFKQAGRMKGETTQKALWGMVTKQIIAMQDIIFKEKNIEYKVLEEICIDISNYMKLLLAIYKEK